MKKMPNNKEEIAKALEEATQEIDILDGLSAVTDWCSTGCTALDLAISNKIPGGIPVGRIVQLFGGASTAKTVLATTILGYALRSGKLAFLADTEHTFDPVFAGYYGLDAKNPEFFYGYSWRKKEEVLQQPTTIEEFFDGYLAGILKLRYQRPKIVVVDSLTVLPAAIEVEKTMDKQGFGAYRAKQIGLGLRKYHDEMVAKQVTLVIIDQTRDSLDSFVKEEIVPGGRSLEFMSSVRLYLKHDKKIENSAGNPIGIWVKFEVKKNKAGPPFRKGSFKILFDLGLDNITSNLSWLAGISENCKSGDEFKLSTQVTFPICKNCGNLGLKVHCCDKDSYENVSKRIMDWVPYIEKNSLEKELQDYVAVQWKIQYATEERKPRVW